MAQPNYSEVLPGVHRIELPLPFELSSVNVYLVRLAEGWLLVDCGIQTNPSFDALAGALNAMGVRWPDLKLVFLTHLHPDHIGLAARVLDLSGARLLMHREDVNLLSLLSAGDSTFPWLNRALDTAGVPQSIQTGIHASFVDMRRNFHALKPDQLLAGGESIPSAIGALQVVWTPGHSPGHVCLYCPERRMLISGDHLLEHITPNIAWQPDRDCLGEFLDSLRGLTGLDIDLVLPAHGLPFSGHDALIRKTVEHHEDRCERILELVEDRPCTAHNMVQGLWKRELAPFHYHFAVFEVLAHLEYLERRGRLRQTAQNGVVWWVHGTC